MSETIQPGALYIVSTPIGNLDDITHRAVQVLKGVDLIAAEDTRKTKFLLDHLSVVKPLLSYYDHNENRRIPELVERLRAGKSVAVVTDAGTPGISDPAFGVIREAIRNGIQVVPVPGASAVLAALITSGLPTERFVFEGFLPVKKGRKTRFEKLAVEERTIVVYESPHRVERTLEDILVYLGDRPVAVVRELTKKFEEVQRGTASQVLQIVRQKPARGEYVIVIAGFSGENTRSASSARTAAFQEKDRP